ncbi:MAG: hypothetical protein K0R62_3753 [Nonomuraea muscovyensis]|nr:hypothetical protein [Nonomuraea muscovyensis]
MPSTGASLCADEHPARAATSSRESPGPRPLTSSRVTPYTDTSRVALPEGGHTLRYVHLHAAGQIFVHARNDFMIRVVTPSTVAMPCPTSALPSVSTATA